MGHVQKNGEPVPEVQRGEEAHVVEYVADGARAAGCEGRQAADLGGVVSVQNQGKLGRSSPGPPRTSGEVGYGSGSGNGCLLRPEAAVTAAVGAAVAQLVVAVVVAAVDVDVDAAVAATAYVRLATRYRSCCWIPPRPYVVDDRHGGS